MPPIILPLDAEVQLPILLADQVGRSISLDANASLASSDPTIAAASIATAADGSAIAVVTPIAAGSATVTFTDGAATVSTEFTVVTPAPTTAAFGNPVFAAKS